MRKVIHARGFKTSSHKMLSSIRVHQQQKCILGMARRRQSSAACRLATIDAEPRLEDAMEQPRLPKEDSESTDSPIDAPVSASLHKSSVGAIQLPRSLRFGVEQFVHDLPYSRKELRLDAERTFGLTPTVEEEYLAKKQKKSHRQAGLLRERLAEQRQVIQYGPRETAAYAVAQLASHYSVAVRVLTELKKRRPEFQPETVLDFGCGPGTAFWAAYPLWRDSIRKMKGIDISEDMVALAETLFSRDALAGNASVFHDPNGKPEVAVQFQQYLSLYGKSPSSDLTIASHVLGDLPSDPIRALTLKTLWSRTKQVLVLVEPGTPEGYRNIVNARHYLLELAGQDTKSESTGAHCVAPCPHDHVCPLLNVEKMWCNFRVRVAEDMLVRTDRISPNQDRSFSYLILQRGPRRPLRPSNDTEQVPADLQADHMPRVLPKLIKNRGQVFMHVCHPDGTWKRLTVTKSQDGNRESFKLARKADWGDLWPGQHSREETLGERGGDNGGGKSDATAQEAGKMVEEEQDKDA